MHYFLVYSKNPYTREVFFPEMQMFYPVAKAFKLSLKIKPHKHATSDLIYLLLDY